MEANIAYKIAMQKVEKTISQIKTELALHEYRASCNPRNWGYVGDVNGVLEELTTILKSLEYKTEESEK